jgi:hypothetical protein
VGAATAVLALAVAGCANNATSGSSQQAGASGGDKVSIMVGGLN